MKKRKKNEKPEKEKKKNSKLITEESATRQLEKEKRRNNELSETCQLLESKIISITSINAALEDQLDQILAENRKLLQEKMDGQKANKGGKKRKKK